MSTEVVLVDYDDKAIGSCEKMLAHEKALLHRAFSVFLFNGDKVLLQKRASSKYHCGGLWTNTCCSHPRGEEDVVSAAKRRLIEELGIHTNELRDVASFVYHRPFANGLTEFEYDHVIVGEYAGEWVINPEEVDDIIWLEIESVKKDIMSNPEKYTPWFITALGEALRNR